MRRKNSMYMQYIVEMYIQEVSPQDDIVRYIKDTN